MTCLIKEARARQFWEDYTADVLGAIMHGLAGIGKKDAVPEFTPYTTIAHPQRKRPRMTYQQTVDYVIGRL